MRPPNLLGNNFLIFYVLLCNILYITYLGTPQNPTEAYPVVWFAALRLREHPMFGDIFPPYVRGHLWVRGSIAEYPHGKGPVVGGWIKPLSLAIVNFIDHPLIIH